MEKIIDIEDSMDTVVDPENSFEDDDTEPEVLLDETKPTINPWADYYLDF